MTKIDYEFIAEFCKINYQNEVMSTFYIADKVLKNTFIFNMPWDMERYAKEVKFDGEINWLYKPIKDPEFTWQFNRHRFMVNLAQAYRLSGDIKYAEKIVELITHWIKNVKVKNDPIRFFAWRSLETGLRPEYWITAIRMILDSTAYTAEFDNLFKDSLRVHMKELINTHKERFKLSNWGVIQDHGLFSIALHLGERDINSGNLKIAMERLLEQSFGQLMKDGVHWEQSPMYHTEVLKCFLDVMINSKFYDIKLPEKFVKNVQKMANVILAWVKPNHKHPLMGDSDNTDVRDILTLCAYIFKDSQFKSLGCKKLDFESAWFFGENGIKEYDDLDAFSPQFTSIGLNDSGNYFMRNNWSENANYLHFINGYTGGGHAHTDKLHFDLMVNGEDVLIDAGRYTYVPSKLRFLLKNPESHNTITVDNKKFIINGPTGWAYMKLAPSIKKDMVIEDEYEIAEGTHLGYLKHFNPVVLTRKIIWLKPSIYLVYDNYNAKGGHTYRRYFHFGPNISLNMKDGVITAKGSKSVTNIHILDSQKIDVIDSKYSYDYNEINDNKAVIATTRRRGISGDLSVILASEATNAHVKTVPLYYQGEKLANRDDAFCVNITNNNDEYHIIFCNKELMRWVKVNDKIGGCGKTIIFKNGELLETLW